MVIGVSFWCGHVHVSIFYFGGAFSICWDFLQIDARSIQCNMHRIRWLAWQTVIDEFPLAGS